MSSITGYGIDGFRYCKQCFRALFDNVEGWESQIIAVDDFPDHPCFCEECGKEVFDRETEIVLSSVYQ